MNESENILENEIMERVDSLLREGHNITKRSLCTTAALHFALSLFAYCLIFLAAKAFFYVPFFGYLDPLQSTAAFLALTNGAGFISLLDSYTFEDTSSKVFETAYNLMLAIGLYLLPAVLFHSACWILLAGFLLFLAIEVATAIRQTKKSRHGSQRGCVSSIAKTIVKSVAQNALVMSLTICLVPWLSPYYGQNLMEYEAHDDLIATAYSTSSEQVYPQKLDAGSLLSC